MPDCLGLVGMFCTGPYVASQTPPDGVLDVSSPTVLMIQLAFQLGELSHRHKSALSDP